MRHNFCCIIPKRIKSGRNDRLRRKLKWYMAGVKGLRRLGHGTYITTNVSANHDDATAFFTYGSVPLVRADHKKRLWLHMDSGYVRPHSYFRLCNGLVHEQNLRKRNRKPDRWETLATTIQPWSTGKHVVVCCVSELNCSLNNINLKRDLNNIKKVVIGRPIIIRPKIQKKIAERPLFEDLREAHVTITWTSASAVESIIAGTPAIVLCNYIAKDVSSSSLKHFENPPKPDREQFLFDLAYHQWTIDEFKKGLPYIDMEIT